MPMNLSIDRLWPIVITALVAWSSAAACRTDGSFSEQQSMAGAARPHPGPFSTHERATALSTGRPSPGVTEERLLDGSETVRLPAPSTSGGMGLRDTLLRRRSERAFRSEPLSLADLSQLLWAAQGVTDARGFRTVPSAGATYPFEIYIVADRVVGVVPGLYHYRIGDHRLDWVRPGQFGEELADLSLGQSWMAQAPVSLILMADVSRTARRYGERADRYVVMEGGAIVQAVSLQAVDLELATVCVGAFDDGRLQELTGTDLLPIAVLPVGRPMH